jgi:predicted nuclease of restriction endonuclease-like RecB superfamily
MLTKELLRFRARSGKVLPEFIDPESGLDKALAADLIEAAQQSVGVSFGEARAGIADLIHVGVISAAGL